MGEQIFFSGGTSELVEDSGGQRRPSHTPEDSHTRPGLNKVFQKEIGNWGRKIGTERSGRKWEKERQRESVCL